MQKVKTTGVKSRMVYSANVSRPGADGSKGDCKRNGNVQSLLEAFRPNGLD